MLIKPTIDTPESSFPMGAELRLVESTSSRYVLLPEVLPRFFWLHAATSLARSMRNHYDPHAASAEEYNNSMVCLGPISPPDRAYESEINSTPNTFFERWDVTPISTYQTPSPCLTTTTSTSGEQMFENAIVSDASSTNVRKKESISSACNRCRTRKTKCSILVASQDTSLGKSPVCRFCHERGLACEWDLLAGVTTNEDLRHKVRETTRRMDDMQVLVSAMQTGSDQTSSMLLAKLRVGVPVSDLAQCVRTGTADQYAIPLYPSSEYR